MLVVMLVATIVVIVPLLLIRNHEYLSHALDDEKTYFPFVITSSSCLFVCAAGACRSLIMLARLNGHNACYMLFVFHGLIVVGLTSYVQGFWGSACACTLGFQGTSGKPPRLAEW